MQVLLYHLSLYLRRWDLSNMERYTIINSNYCKNTFLFSYESFKQILAAKYNTYYGVIKIKLIPDNYKNGEYVYLLKSVALFLKSQFSKNDFVTCIDKDRFLWKVFIQPNL